MINVCVAGGLGKDAETKQVSGSTVTKFSVASSTKVKGEEKTIWLDCDYWGKAGESVAQFLTKGKQVFVTGSLSTREHDGKTYLSIRVDNLKLMGGGARSEGGPSNRSTSKPATKPSGFDSAEFDGGDDSDIPF